MFSMVILDLFVPAGFQKDLDSLVFHHFYMFASSCLVIFYCSNNICHEKYAGGSLATGRAADAEQGKG